MLSFHLNYSSRARMYIVKSEVNESNKWSHRSYSSDRRYRVKEGREYFISFSANLGHSVKQKD
jgi:hypothetical protein